MTFDFDHEYPEAEEPSLVWSNIAAVGFLIMITIEVVMQMNE